MQASSLRAAGRKIMSLTAPIRIVLALVSHASLNHALCFFAPVLPTLTYTTVRQIMALALELPYVLIDYMCAGGLALVHTYIRKTEWNRMDASARDPFSIRAMSVRAPFNSSSIYVFLKRSTV